MPGGQTYVYGITRSGAASSLPAAGVDGRPVSHIDHGSLSAIVSTDAAVPVKANRRNLMAHTAVLSDLASTRCVLPMRFGIVMPGDTAVRDELLEPHEQALDSQLEAFEDLVELDVKVVCPEEELIRAIVADRPELANLSEQIRGKPADATYFDRIRLGELVAGAVEETRHALLGRVLGRLEPLAVSTHVGEPAHEHMLVNVAFLVNRSHVGRFDDAAASMADELGPDLRCKYVGPLPPFHFVETAAEPGSVAWA
jgi:gas vesicle protein GvpL/GvpF